MEYNGKIESHLKLEIDASTPPLPPNELSDAQRIMRKNFQDYIIEKNWRSLAASRAQSKSRKTRTTKSLEMDRAFCDSLINLLSFIYNKNLKMTIIDNEPNIKSSWEQYTRNKDLPYCFFDAPSVNQLVEYVTPLCDFILPADDILLFTYGKSIICYKKGTFHAYINKQLIEEKWFEYYKTNNSYKAIPINEYKTISKLLDEFYSRWFDFIDRHIGKWNRIFEEKLNKHIFLEDLFHKLIESREYNFKYINEGKYFRVIDNTLYFYLDNANGIGTEMPINDDTIGLFAYSFCFESEEKKVFTDLLPYYQKYFIAQKKKLGTPSNHIFFYVDELHPMRNTRYRTTKFLLEGKAINCFKEVSDNNPILCEANSGIQIIHNPSKTVSFDIPYQLLNDISDSKSDILDEFSQFLACCLGRKKKYNVFAFHKNINYSDLCRFIQTVSLGPHTFPEICSLRDLADQGFLNKLIQYKIERQFVLPVSVSSKDLANLTSEKRAYLKKLLSGKQISINDDILGKRKHKSELTYLLFGNEQDIKSLEKALETKIQSVSFSLPQECSLTKENILWIQFYLLLWGYSPINSTSKKSKSTASEDGSILPSVRSFIEKCCEFSDGSETKQSDLYNAYKLFCSTINLKPIKVGDFSKQLMNNYDLKRYRPHYKANTNPYYFQRIALREDRNEMRQPETETPNFHNYLRQIEDELNKKYPELANILGFTV